MKPGSKPKLVKPLRIDPPTTTAETRKDVATQERNERAYYNSAKDFHTPFRMPLTIDGVEALLEIACAAMDLPLDDTIRQVFCGMIHHKSQTEVHITMGEVTNMVHKNYANNVTFTIDQQTKENTRLKAEAERQVQEKIKASLEVVPEPKTDTAETTANTLV